MEHCYSPNIPPFQASGGKRKKNLPPKTRPKKKAKLPRKLQSKIITREIYEKNWANNFALCIGGDGLYYFPKNPVHRLDINKAMFALNTRYDGRGNYQTLQGSGDDMLSESVELIAATAWNIEIGQFFHNDTLYKAKATCEVRKNITLYTNEAEKYFPRTHGEATQPASS